MGIILTTMKKMFFLLTIVSFLTVSCEKDEELINEKQTNQNGLSAYSSLIYNVEYIPEDYENQLQLFFDDIDKHTNEEDIEIEKYSISDGIWNFISSLNYTKSFPFSKVIDVEEYEYEVLLSFFNQEEDFLSSQSLIEEFIDMHETLDSLNTDNSKLLLLSFNSVELSDSSIILYLKATKAIIENFDEVDLATCPNGVPTSASLKMGVPYNGYKSAAHEYQDRYNPYLWASKMRTISLPFSYYLVQNHTASQVLFGWTNYTNCHYNWPVGDYIPYVNWSNQGTYKQATISGSRFYLYLSRFWQKEVEGMIFNNTQYNRKYLYLSANVYWNPDCQICGYINNGYAVSYIGFLTRQADVIKLTKPLNTYTY